MKRLLSTILALTLLCSMSIPAFAAEGEMSAPPMSDNSVQTDVEQEPDQPAAPITVSTLDELKSAIAAAPNVATIYIDNCIMISDETVSTEKIITLARTDGYAGDLISLGSNGGISGFTFYDTRDFSNTIIVGVDAENAMIERCIFSGSENALTWFICVCGSASVVNCYFADGGFAIQNTDIGTVTVRDCTVVGVSLPDGESPVLNNGTMTMEHTNVYQNTSGVLNNGNLTVNGCEIADNISTGGVDIDNRGTLSISADTANRGFYKTDIGEEVTLPLSEYSDPAMFVCLTEEQAKEYFAPPTTPDEEPTPTPEPTPEPDVEEPTTTPEPTPEPEPTPDPGEDDNYTPPSRPSRPSRPAQPTTEKEPVTEQDAAPVFACGDAVIDVSRSVVLQGYGDGLLHLEDYLTRGQMATIIYRLLDDDTLEKYDTADSVFSDVPKDSWCCRYVSTIANAGIVAGIGNGNFSPNSRLTWAHILTVLTRFVTAQDYALQSIRYDGWALKSVKTAVALGWIEDTANFNPNAPITRGEFTDLVNGVLALYQAI